MERLLEWARLQGVCLRKIGLSDVNGREFVALADIEPPDAIISVPQHLLMHAGVAKSSSDYGAAFELLLKDIGSNVDERHILCLLLILERTRAAESTWAAYINVLPNEYDDPYWWTSEEQQLVKGTRLSKAIEQYMPGLHQLSDWVKRLEDLHCSLGPGGGPKPLGLLSSYQDGWAFTLDAVRWARSTVWSRSFTVHRLRTGADTEGGPAVALIPVLDMIDHHPDVEVVWHTGPDGREDFQFCPLTPVTKGSVLRNNYGAKTNDELILAYGFAVPSNVADYFQVSIAQARPPPQPADAPGPAASSWVIRAVKEQDVLNQTLAQPASTGSGPGGSSGRSSTPFNSDAYLARDGAEGMSGEGASALQLHAESLQREIAMVIQGHGREHRLSEAEPLPSSLVNSARLCLMSTHKLYQLSARLMEEARGEEACDAAETSQEPRPTRQVHEAGNGSAGLAASDPAGSGADASGTSALPSREAGRGLKRPASDLLAGNYLSSSFPESAMHIVPRSAQRQLLEGSSSPSALTAAASDPNGGTVLHNAGCASPSGAPSSGPEAMAVAAAAVASLELPILVSLQLQLEAKLRGMVSELQARSLLSMHDAMSPLLFNSGTTLSPASLEPLGVSGHAALALTYVNGQRRILQGSLREIRARIGSAVLAMHRHVLPAPQPVQRSGFGGQGSPAAVAFDVVSGDSEEAALAALGGGVCSVQNVFGVSGAQHMNCYARWLEDVLERQVAAAGDEAWGAGPRLREVTCLARKEALSAAAAASRVGPSSSGSRGKRRSPLASVTLRVMRNASGGDQRGRTASPTNSQSSAPSGSDAPSLPPGISASLGMDLDLKHDPVAWGAETMADVQRGDILIQVPEECAVMAGSREELLACLMVPAHALLEELVLNAAGHRRSHAVTSLPTPSDGSTPLRPADAAAAAAALGPSSSEPSCSVPPTTKLHQRQLRPHDMLVLHLLHMVGAAPSVRLPASESEQASMLLEMLEDSPAGSAYQEAFEVFKSDFEELTASTHEAAHNSAVIPRAVSFPAPPAHRRGSTSTNSDSGGGGGEQGNDGGGMSAGRPRHSSGSRSKLSRLSKVLAWPGALGLFCWASAVVERCAVCVRPTELTVAGGGVTASGTSTVQEEHQSLWAVLPVVSAVPTELRDALLRVELSPLGSSRRLVARALCNIPSGLLLAPPLLLPHACINGLMDSYGPEALAWRRLLARQGKQQHEQRQLLQQQRQQGQELLRDSEEAPAKRPAPARASSVSRFALGAATTPAAAVAAGNAAGPSSGNTACDASGTLYELYISPSEQDPLYQEKMELLSASGLGTLHYLTPGLETGPMVSSALKICLADEDLLMHPLVHQVMQINQALVIFKAQGEPEVDDLMAAAAVTAGEGKEPVLNGVILAAGPGSQARGSSPHPGLEHAPTHALASSVGVPKSSSGSVPHGFMQLVQQGQLKLVEMLEALPNSHEVSGAAQKQLRHIVSDARKHARRRLRQMDTQEQQAAGGGSFWSSSGSAAGGAAPRTGTTGLELLRQGVRIYLEEITLVLDAWAAHLGIETKLEPSSKKPKLS